MKVSYKTIEFIAENMIVSPYRSGQDLVNFFNSFGAQDISITNSLSRKNYAISKLTQFNDSATLEKIINEIVDPINFTDIQECRNLAVKINKYLVRDGYKIVPQKIMNRNLPMEMIEDLHVNIACGDCSEIQARGIEDYTTETIYTVEKIESNVVSCETITNIDNDYINAQIIKSKKKLSEKDFDGAITNSRTLVETVLSNLLENFSEQPLNYDGDLIKMYKALKPYLNLDSSKDLNDTLKQILTGLNSIVSGLGGLSNKMSDRHHKTYKTQEYHAKLAINTAFTFCEFLLDSYKYQFTFSYCDIIIRCKTDFVIILFNSLQIVILFHSTPLFIFYLTTDLCHILSH